MRGPNGPLKILLPQVALFLPVQEPKECDAVEVIYLCQGLAVGLDGF